MKMITPELNQDFTWVNTCEDCGKDFECSKHIPKRIINKMIKQKSDDCVFNFMSTTDNNKVRLCKSCRTANGAD